MFIILTLVVAVLIMAGCGSGGGGVSSQVVSGNAAVGVPLAGQVSLKDSSSPPQQKTTVIGSDGSFAFDVTGLKAPYILQGNGTVSGVTYKLHSFASGTGIANVNPLSNVVVAGAAGVSDPQQVYAAPDALTLNKIKTGLPVVTSEILNKLQPLLALYNAIGKNPITDHYDADHQGLDGMFDDVTITITNGVVAVVNAQSGAVIFTASVVDITNGQFSTDPASLPQPPAVPASPTAVSAAVGTGQVTLSWSAVSGASSYNLYYSTTPGVTTVSGTKISNATTPYLQSGLAAGTSYYYIVTALNSSGESNPSAQVSASVPAASAAPAMPASPSGVIATGGTKQVTLSWNSVSTAASYNVYYATSPGVTTTNGTKIANVTSPAVHSDLSDATSYYYIVTAVNGSGEGAASVQVAATTLSPVPSPTVPTKPSGLNAVGGVNQVTLSWTAVAGASSYNIYWSATSGVTTVSGTKVSGITSPYVKTGLAAGTPYYFIVTAVNSVGESVASAQVTATTSAPVTKQLTLAWDAVANATSYNLYWSTVPGVTPANGTKISGVSSPYTHTGLAAGTTYYYVVTAVDSTSESSASSPASGTTSL
ncbi:MAG: fibronectin type III domain-containing protein [Desulfuromonadaceae bacterium]|nr:fibronectin type III domain-containing protein [Desulfuromonadaceae bacterium]MDD2849112.1 fibronectin type III domain-containing protein [Desulfuromonadaceae bacterium]MDD4129480.1 fibronectin type III domain-containing protein [Desulfuromonadaceae bacterium]